MNEQISSFFPVVWCARVAHFSFLYFFFVVVRVLCTRLPSPPPTPSTHRINLPCCKCTQRNALSDEVKRCWAIFFFFFFFIFSSPVLSFSHRSEFLIWKANSSTGNANIHKKASDSSQMDGKENNAVLRFLCSSSSVPLTKPPPPSPPPLTIRVYISFYGRSLDRNRSRECVRVCVWVWCRHCHNGRQVIFKK